MGMNLIIGTTIVLIGIVLIGLWNNLIGRKNAVKQASSSIDVMLQKRWELVPNLVECVRTFMEHEKALLEKLTNLRVESQGGNSDIQQAIEKFKVTLENYPDLKSQKTVVLLQRSLNEVEEQLAASRRAYNATVTRYNNGREMFPLSFVAFLMRLKPIDWHEISEDIPKQGKIELNLDHE